MVNIRNLLILLLMGILLYSEAPAEQYHNYTKNDSRRSIFTIDLQSISDAQSALPHKQNAEDKLSGWLLDFRLTDFLIVVFTGVLAWKTSGLHKETAAMRTGMDEQRADMLRSVKATEMAAAAAMKSADIAERSLSELERPWLFLRGIHIDYRVADTTNAWQLKLHFTNVGRSPAIITECVFNVVSKSIATENPDYTKCTDKVGFVKTLSAGDDSFTERIGLDSSSYFDIDLVLYGKLTYKGLGGAQHVSGFGLIPARVKNVDPDKKPFDLYGGDTYNYYT